MKEIIIIPGCTDLNRGDQALVWETAELIRAVNPECNFTVLESGTNPDDIELQSRQTRVLGYTILPKVLRHPSRISNTKTKKSIKYTKLDYLLWGFQSIIDLIYTSALLSRFSVINNFGKLFLSASQIESLKRFQEANLIAVKGGGFIHAYGRVSDFYTMYFSLYHILLAHRFQKDVIVFPNSIGPVKGYFTRKLVKYVLRNCKLITAREQVSLNYLSEDLKIKAKLYPDLGFYLKNTASGGLSYLIDKGVPIGAKKTVGITLRPYRFPNSEDPEQRYKEYIAEINAFVKLAVENDYHPIFFAHTLGPGSHEDDRLAIIDVRKTLNQNLLDQTTYIEDFNLNCIDVMDLYSHLDFMVGTRFHSVIFALNVNVPSIAIAYGGNKSFGIMNDMKLPEFVYPIEKFSGQTLFNLMESGIENKADYLNKIKNYRFYLEEIYKEFINDVDRILK
jgi:colanic acid/amylovoran biosynthesis protein